MSENQLIVDKFNEICHPGEPVIVEKDNGEKVKTVVKYPAELLGGHSPVVWLNGISGCYALNRVTVVIGNNK